MNEEENHMQDESEIIDLIKRYEHMVESGDSHFFDVNEFEIMIGHFLGFSDIKQAQKVLQYASSLFPESLTLQLREAQILASIGKHIKAISRLKTLLAFEPHNDEIHLTLASIYSKMSEHHLAINHFNKALLTSEIELKPEIIQDIALEYENLGEWRKAIELLKKCLKIDTSYESALFELAYCYDQVNDIKSAIAFFEKYLDHKPYSTLGWYNLGNSYHRLGSLKKAINAYDFSIAIDKTYLRAYIQKAEALTTCENFREALEVYDEILELETATPHTLCCIGECYEKLGDFINAENYYKKCLEIDSDFSDAFVGLGVVADLQSDISLSIRFFERAVQIEPEHADFRLLLATSFMKLAKPQEAETQFAAIIEKFPKNVEAWEGRIDNLQRLDAHEAALEVLKEGIEVVNEPTHLRYQQFFSFFASGKEAKAFDLLDMLLINHYESASRFFNSFPDLLNDNRIAERYNRLKP
jgi:tetratricopeptide (TPR) repeat protein